jgi:hypothetical protein
MSGDQAPKKYFFSSLYLPSSGDHAFIQCMWAQSKPTGPFFFTIMFCLGQPAVLEQRTSMSSMHEI